MSSRQISRLSVFAVILLSSNMCLADTTKQDAQAAASKWDEAYNKGDLDGIAKSYARDAVVVTKGAPKKATEIAEFFSGLKAKGFDDHRTTVNDVIPKDNLLIATGRWEMMGPSEGGAKKKFEGNWVNVMERQDDGWRTVLHTWN